MRVARAWGAGLDLGAKKRLEAWGRDDGVFILLPPSLATSVADPKSHVPRVPLYRGSSLNPNPV